MSDGVEPDQGSTEGRSANFEEGLQPLHARAVLLWRLTGAGWSLALLVTAAAALFLPGSPVAWPGPILAAWAAVAALLVGVLPPIRYRAWGYRLRAGDLVVRRGVVWRIITVVPYSKIQHVDTQRGPIERLLGLAAVVVHTAASRGGAVAIRGLAEDDAEDLRDRLAALSGLEEAL